MEQRYLYSINPKTRIVNIPGIAVIRSPKSLSLSKDEVVKCLKVATVYRRFANENKIEKVTNLNIDRLHNAKFISEEQWKVMNIGAEEERGTVVNNAVEEIVPEVVEETVEEVAPAVEEVVEETVEEVVEENNNESEEVESKEEVVEEAKEEAVVENKNKNYYNGKNKHKH